MPKFRNILVQGSKTSFVINFKIILTHILTLILFHFLGVLIWKNVMWKIRNIDNLWNIN